MYAEGETETLSISLFDSANSTGSLIGELRLDTGRLTLRNNNDESFTFPIGFDEDEFVKVQLTWNTSSATQAGTYSVAINDVSYGPFIAENETPNVEVTALSIRLSSNGNTASTAVLIDDIAIHSDEAGTVNVFSESFESYDVGADLSADPFNSATFSAVVTAIGPIETDVLLGCVNSTLLSTTASASGDVLTYIDQNDNVTNLTPDLAIDGLITTESFWQNNSSKTLTLDFNQSITIDNVAILWREHDQVITNFDVETSVDGITWVNVLSSKSSDTSVDTFEIYDLISSTAQYLRVTGNGDTIGIIEIVANHCGDLTDIPGDIPAYVKPVLNSSAQSNAIELIDWYLNTPEIDRVDDGVDIAVRIDEIDLANDYEDDFFFPSADGGLVFAAPLAGGRTSSGTKFTRTELREMLRRGTESISTQGINQNNWVFDNATTDQQTRAAAVGGRLEATLSVDYVSISGDESQVGRVIIGQIHANDDEPIRLYYRKLPSNSKGAIYFAHEPQEGDDVYTEMIGTRSRSLPNPEDGIALGEVFSYVIDVTGTTLTVTISREGKDDLVADYDMSDSGYYPSVNDEEQYMYFKAGVYNQNNTGYDHDYGLATFYDITNTH